MNLSLAVGLLTLTLCGTTEETATVPWLRLWGPGETYRERGEAEITGRPGREFYRRVGEWTFWYRNGNKKQEGTFSGETKIGAWDYWYESGGKQAEGGYDEAGRQEGPWQWWNEDGQPARKGAYRGGKETGPWTFWFEAGGKEREGAYREGNKEGTWIFWYPDGELRCQGDFRQGLETGVWTYREKIGEEYVAWTYDYGKIIAAEIERDASSPAQALIGHWITEKDLSGFRERQQEQRQLDHIYFDPDGIFTQVRDGFLQYSEYALEEQNPEKRTFKLRLSDEEGKGAVLFGLFSRDYRRMVGRYYLVDFLRGSRGKLTNYFEATYAGGEAGPNIRLP